MTEEIETIYRSEEGTTLGEIESMAIKSILEANGIQCLVVGDSVFPMLGFEVRVASERAEEARRVIAEAQANGPEAAQEAELQSESKPEL